MWLGREHEVGCWELAVLLVFFGAEYMVCPVLRKFTKLHIYKCAHFCIYITLQKLNFKTTQLRKIDAFFIYQYSKSYS